MNDNKKHLISQLEGNDLNNQYTHIRVINCDRLTGRKIGHQGALSVVFRATDKGSGKPVAVKFFDPDIQAAGAPYRMDLFERESRLLAALPNGKRFLRIVQPLTYHPLQFTMPSGVTVTFSYRYFVTEWLDEDVEEYFYNCQHYDAVAKLEVFRECCLAIFALHNQDMAHRDVKPDNLRFAQRRGKRVGVAIDLGTAVSHQSPQLGGTSEYSHQIGARGFAPLEARYGLAGIRALGVPADYYALGCLLFELFNLDTYYITLLSNMGYQSCRSACEQHMLRCGISASDEKSLIKAWSWIISKTKNQVSLPNINSTPGSVPASIRGILNRLLSSLTNVDYRYRLRDPRKVIEIVDSATRVLKNHALDAAKAAVRKTRRENRVRKEIRRQQKLEEYLRRNSRSIENV